MSVGRRFFSLPPSIRIATYYLLFSVAWIFLSDQALSDFQTTKGLAFVTVSALGLGYFIHRAWEAREQTERRFQAVVEHAGELISIVDPEGVRYYHSPAIKTVLGYETEDMTGKTILDDVHPDDRSMTRDFLTSIASKPRTIGWLEVRALHADGSIRNLLTTATNLLEDPAVRGIVLNSRDITDRKRSEMEIARQLARLDALHKIDRAILESRRLQETLEVVLEHVISQLEVDAASVLLYDRQNQDLVFGHGIGFRGAAIQEARVPVDEIAAGEAMLARHPRIVSNLADSDDVVLRRDLLVDEGFLGYAAFPLIAKEEMQGVLELHFRNHQERSADWLMFAEALAAQTAIAIDSARLVGNLQQANEELEAVYDRTLEGWAAAVELNDDETEGHSRRVVDFTLRLARELGVSETDLVHIRRGALLHDIGKIGIPDRILLKPGPLDANEWEIMRRHPTYAYDLLKPISYLHPALDIPRHHHERWDGSGYPDGLSGEDIPLYARIFAVVDVYDALMSDRPYRPAWSMESTLEYIENEAGTLFDPAISAVFLAMMDSQSATATSNEPSKVNRHESSS
ncbi:hypothetical protein BH23CHL2_BH23CHL2_14380 [soil metagenome]